MGTAEGVAEETADEFPHVGDLFGSAAERLCCRDEIELL
jgi:hypothetical protein